MIIILKFIIYKLKLLKIYLIGSDKKTRIQRIVNRKRGQ